MGSEADEGTPPKLPLLSLPPTKSIESYGGMGMASPPHLTASIPFRWEEEPGKPRPPLSTHSPTTLKGLELPPRLLYGPPAVLEGPCVGRSLFHSSRFIRCREVSFHGGGTDSVRSLVVSKRWLLHAEEKPPGFGRVRQKEAPVVDDGDAGFAFCGDTRNVRKRSMLGLSKPKFHFWAAIYEAVKQVIPTPRPRRSTNANSKSSTSNN